MFRAGHFGTRCRKPEPRNAREDGLRHLHEWSISPPSPVISTVIRPKLHAASLIHHGQPHRHERRDNSSIQRPLGERFTGTSMQTLESACMGGRCVDAYAFPTSTCNQPDRPCAERLHFTCDTTHGYALLANRGFRATPSSAETMVISYCPVRRFPCDGDRNGVDSLSVVRCHSHQC